MRIPHVFGSEEFIGFCRGCLGIAASVRAVLTALLLLIVAGGWLLNRVESLGFWEGQYLAFITALTIGYGDITPATPVGKVTSIVLGVIGMVAMGLVVGIASVALRQVMERKETAEAQNQQT
jgi:voltage-gated potassium channel